MGVVQSGTGLKKARREAPRSSGLPPFLRDDARKLFASSHYSRLVHLTPREREIALWIASGDRNKEIANRLEITERTVKAHLTSIFRKLGLTDRLRLALFILGRKI